MAGALHGPLDAGRLRRSPPLRSPRGGDDNVVPLINIIFLLLLFFMVAGELALERKAGVEPPASVSDRPVPRRVPVLVLDTAGELWLDGRRVSPDATAGALAAGGVAPRRIGLLADAGAGGARLADVLAAFAAAGVGEVALTTRRRSNGANR